MQVQTMQRKAQGDHEVSQASDDTSVGVASAHHPAPSRSVPCMSGSKEMTADEVLNAVAIIFDATVKDLTNPKSGGSIAPQAAVREAIRRHAGPIATYYGKTVDEMVSDPE